MMAEIFLTPASLGYLTQLILSTVITYFLVTRLKGHNLQSRLLTAFFITATFFIGLLFLDAVLPPFSRLWAVYAENTVLGLALVFLIQFAYQYPRSIPKYEKMAFASLLLSLAYTIFEAVYMVNRYVALLGTGRVYYRTASMDYCVAFVLLLVPIAFSLQCIASDPRKIRWWRKLAHPQGKAARGAQIFILNFGVIFLLGIVNVLRTYGVLPTGFYNASLSIGILIALWMFSTNYINFVPGGLSIQVKLSILYLTLFLALLGSVGWAIAPAYVSTFHPDLLDHKTLRFTPAGAGGYTITERDFSFDSAIGEEVLLNRTGPDDDYRIERSFTYFGKTYSVLYASYPGVVSMGEPFWQPDMQNHSNHQPAIFPLMLDLNPDQGGGLYVKESADRLVITWYKLPSQYHQQDLYTFQVALYNDGVFDISYRDLPQSIIFMADETPSANPWLRGAAPGAGENLHFSDNRLSGSIQYFRGTMIENYQLEFRRHLHAFMLPLVVVVIGGSLLLILALPKLLSYSIAKPLENLLAGIHQIEKGNLDTTIPFTNEDEFGLLTLHFNKMTSRLNDLVTGLEKRVAERTQELSEANESLRHRLEEINLLQAELKEQSIRDPLTNAFNRRYMMEILEKELARAKRESKPFSLIMLDVDHFKEFNDEFGHQAGDLILNQLVELIQVHIRKEDTVCRFGGEEFVILLPKAQPEDAQRVAEDLRAACEGLELKYKGQLLNITISLGVVGGQWGNTTVGEILKVVDESLYQAKNAGRNCVYLTEHS